MIALHCVLLAFGLMAIITMLWKSTFLFLTYDVKIGLSWELSTFRCLRYTTGFP